MLNQTSHYGISDSYVMCCCSEWNVLCIAGGHGIVFDAPKDKDFIALGNKFWAEGKVVGSVCHGPACLVSLTAPDGSPVVKGHKVFLSALNGLKICCMCAIVLIKINNFLFQGGQVYKIQLACGACQEQILQKYVVRWDYTKSSKHNHLPF